MAISHQLNIFRGPVLVLTRSVGALLEDKLRVSVRKNELEGDRSR